jgi:hypothetical protein
MKRIGEEEERRRRGEEKRRRIYVIVDLCGNCIPIKFTIELEINV